ncbi:MAG: hypothetical protein WBW53_00405 [Terriglobales bacterium]
MTALLGVLVMKGVLAPAEANAIRNAAPTAQFQALVEVLSRKGLVSADDLSAATHATPQPSAISVVRIPEGMSTSRANTESEPSPQAKPAPQAMQEMKPTAAAVIPAVAPVRVFPVDPPKAGGLSGLKVGPITIAPYGFVKATVVHDSSDPDGDDFPFPGIWLNAASATNTGPTQDPEFHVKARSTRFGSNFEWPDISKKLTLTGKIEGDFEGNFSEVDNRDVSSIRSSQPQLRLAYVRLDYHVSDATDVFFLGGQDWTLFGSGVLPNLLETTFLGAYWGDIYTRSPQLRGGFVQTLSKEHSINFETQLGIMMPSTGQILKLGSLGLPGQLGQGEREGADSDRPEWEGRMALSYQLDKAKGVAPAQIALSGFYGKRTSIAFNSSSQYTTMCTDTPNYCAAFPNGFTASSNLYGGQLAVQVPTRWFTLVASAYRGGDLRFYFGGQINTYATDTGGLVGIQGPLPTLDGGPLLAAGGAVLGCNVALDPSTGDCPTPGNVVVAPQRAIRSFGGFINLGLPLSRWFNASPHGHNAGWQLYLDLGKDQVVNRDLNNPNYLAAYNGGGTAPLPLAMGKMAAATLYYKLNPWCQFGFEQSIYASRMLDHLNIYTIAGVPSNEWQDHRTEFGPIFTF